MKKLSQIYESLWADIQSQASGDAFKKEDRIQDPEYWWKNIPLPNAPKYPKDQLSGLDLAYKYFVWPIEKALNIKWPENIYVYFQDEPYWYLDIEHTQYRGSNSYSVKAHGHKGYNPTKWSEMSLPEKRGIKFRIENRKFYLYPDKQNGSKIWNFYVREVPEYKGEKGIELK